jgi:hypothetical protein
MFLGEDKAALTLHLVPVEDYPVMVFVLVGMQRKICGQLVN